MLDDSDDHSDGEFKFYFFLNDKLVVGNPQTVDLPDGRKMEFPTHHVFRIIGTGQTRKIDWLGYTDNVDQVKISVSGIDDDDDPDIIAMLDTQGTGGPPDNPLGTGETSIAEWATGTITVKTPNPKTGKAVRTPFELDANGHKRGIDLRFKVKGEVIVTYG
ncbi:MAG TPA: hypothetical protein VK404_05030 [Spirosoma sp.]|jgi:hypothetical protein|nr:hypothetical protein [Spirosoma sp.]